MRRIRHIITTVLLIIIVASCGKDSGNKYKVQRGSFKQSIVETGELAAVDVRAFVMQRYGRYWYELKITGMIEHGTEVEPGDSVIQLDGSEIKRFIIERENQLESERANLEKVKVEIDNQKSDYQSNLLSEQAAFDLKKLEVETFKFESDKIKKIKELEFQQAEIRLNKVKRNVELYEIISYNTLKIQELRVERLELRINKAREIIPELTIRSPISGIFQIARKRRSRDLLKIGDEVYAGRNLGNVPDLDWMKVETYVNEADFMKIYEGQKVLVRLDALHDVDFEAEVSKISKICHPIDRDARQKVFDVEVRMLHSDKRLKPGMTVSCEFICNDLENVLHIPLNYVENIDGENFAYVDKGNQIVKRPVKTGASNNTRIVIIEGLSEKEKLVSVSEAHKQDNI